MNTIVRIFIGKNIELYDLFSEDSAYPLLQLKKGDIVSLKGGWLPSTAVGCIYKIVRSIDISSTDKVYQVDIYMYWRDNEIF